MSLKWRTHQQLWNRQRPSLCACVSGWDTQKSARTAPPAVPDVCAPALPIRTMRRHKLKSNPCTRFPPRGVPYTQERGAL